MFSLKKSDLAKDQTRNHSVIDLNAEPSMLLANRFMLMANWAISEALQFQ